MPEPATSPVTEPEKTDKTTTPMQAAVFLQQHRQGGLHNELGEEIAAVTAAVTEHQKKGSVTVTLTISPTKDDPRAVVIYDELKSKAPKATPLPSRFFTDEHGTLSRRDPRQPELTGLRDATAG
jgi:hypothetical protein